jgi:energy-coupling factor transporter ATP-binding protein EcfA2
MKIICIVGSDGSGKSTLAKYVVEVLAQQGYKPVLVWSRYNHLFSKPLLAFARLIGRSPRETHEGVIFGYHYFNVWYLKWPFILLQCLDVNIAVRWQLWRARSKGDVVVFERSPWDTLADVMLDVTEREKQNAVGKWSEVNSDEVQRLTPPVSPLKKGIARLFVSTMKGAQAFLISRPIEQIIKSRPTMRYDRDLARKIACYEYLAEVFGWLRLDNSGSLEETQEKLRQHLLAEIIFNK